MRDLTLICCFDPSFLFISRVEFLLRMDVVQAGDRDLLVALDAERGGAVGAEELQRQHAHADQVGAVDALEAARDHRLDAEQLRALGGPVARRAGAVFLAAEDHRRRAVGDVAHGRVVNRAAFHSCTE